ncbi:Mitochondrial metalloendopeptidase OMA1 [Exophiala dermatitidis]
MFTSRVGLRVAGRAARFSPKPTFPFQRVPHFQPRRTFYERPRYTRFGERRSNYQQQQWSNFGPMLRAQYLWRSYQRPIIIAGTGGAVFYVYNLEEVPITHRRRFNILSPDTEKQLSEGAYEQTLQQYRGKILPANHPLTKLVARVTERLLPTTGGLAGDDWRVHVIDDPNMQNAFVVPGGKVFVFTGILPICETEAGVATVLGHEIAHNVAHHMAERLSRSSITLIASILFSLIFQVDTRFSNSVVDLLLELPNSRTQETEADHIGLLMMAEACYDPRDAVAFWERMKASEKVSIPQFMSTHPSHYDRVNHIKKWLPDAQTIYVDKGCADLSGFANDFRRTIRSQQPRSSQVHVQQPRMRGRGDDDYF